MGARSRLPRRAVVLSATVLLGLALLAGLTYWGLASGALSLGWLETRIETRLNEELAPLTLDLRGGSMRFSGLERPLSVSFAEVLVTDSAGSQLAELADFSVALAAGALLTGHVVPERLDIEHLELALVRRSDGSFSLSGDEPEQSTESGKSGLVEWLLEGPEPGAAMGRLTEMGFHGIVLRVEDRKQGITWGLHDADLDIERDASGIECRMSFAPGVDGPRGKVTADGAYSFGDRTLTTQVALDPGAVTELSRLVPGLGLLEAVEEPLQGRVDLVFSEDLTLETVEIESLDDSQTRFGGRVDIDQAGGLEYQLSFESGVEEPRGKIAADGTYSFADRRLTTRIAVDPAGATELSRLVPGLGLLEAVEEPLQGRAELMFSEGLTLETVEIESLDYSQTRLGGRVDIDEAGDLEVLLRGTHFEIDRVLTGLVGAERGGGPGDAEADFSRRVSLDIGLDEISRRGKVVLKDFAGTAALAGGSVENARLAARAVSGEPIEGAFATPREGLSGRLSAANAGALLESLGVTAVLDGGQLELTATKAAREAPFLVHLEVADMQLLESHLLSRILSLASLTGMLATLDGEGFEIQRLDADLSLEDGKLHFDQARVYGPGLALTLHGVVDIRGDAWDMQGVAAHMGAVEKAIGKIPGIRKIFLGRDQAGLVGTEFTLTGPLAEPDVNVQPMSALTPGILREFNSLKELGD